LDGEENRDDRVAADRLLAKIRTFVADRLTEEEAALFAALLAPGVACAYDDSAATASPSDVEWCPHALPDSLAEAVRDRAIRVQGLAGA
jgi:uncharacterized protein (DUF2267 family)